MVLAVAARGCFRLRFGLRLRFRFSGFAVELIGCLVFRQIKSISNFLLPLDKSGEFFGVLEGLLGLLPQVRGCVFAVDLIFSVTAAAASSRF